MSKLMVRDTSKTYSEMAMKGYSLKLLSEEIGVTNQYLSTVLRGKRNPSPGLAKKIARSLGLEINDIFLVVNIAKVKHGEEVRSK